MHVQSGTCHLQHGNRLGPIDSGEVDQELIEGVSCLQIVEEVLHRDARGSEYGHSALDRGIPVYDWFFHSSAARDDESEPILPLRVSETA